MNWIELKALNKLYNTGKVKINQTLAKSPVFKSHKDALEIERGRKFFTRNDIFIEVYEKRYLKDFEKYSTFLEAEKLLKPQLRFNKKDIDLLIQFKQGIADGSLLQRRNELKEAQESVRGFSHMFFKNDKYLDGKTLLIDAINKIFNITLVDNKSQQYLYVLQCEAPKLIILCENGNFLNRDKIPRANGYELWYAGGRNIPKLEYTHQIRRGLPIYYSGDWDKDGLEIFELAKQKIPDLELLFPNGVSKSISATDHKSLWKYPEAPEKLSGLNPSLYTKKDKNKIIELITKNHWITEEGNNLKVMIDNYSS
ncbi:Wadjet anti-phage system protein JetD domain-containing protein [Bizionia paragorgiae]|uniref:Wadjet anti-phage system protein JetD domain-containing protein n=1 Tax=Bizionia paragorgiae TaxID=283786 RepID=UPI003A8CDA9A